MPWHARKSLDQRLSLWAVFLHKGISIARHNISWKGQGDATGYVYIIKFNPTLKLIVSRSLFWLLYLKAKYPPWFCKIEKIVSASLKAETRPSGFILIVASGKCFRKHAPNRSRNKNVLNQNVPKHVELITQCHRHFADISSIQIIKSKYIALSKAYLPEAAIHLPAHFHRAVLSLHDLNWSGFLVPIWHQKNRVTQWETERATQQGFP